MFECKLDPHIFRGLVTKLVNERAHLATKAISDFAFYHPPLPLDRPNDPSDQWQLCGDDRDRFGNQDKIESHTFSETFALYAILLF